MTSFGSVVQHAAFVRGATGSRFRLVSRPETQPPVGTVIAVHAFAEEMNKCRRMTARMARMLAADGWQVVQRDLFGCGDSSGDFGDASWDAWLLDVLQELDSADAQRPVWLWSVRGGALLAAAAVLRHPRVNLLLWHPALAGAQHLQQFLRLHAAARIVGSGKSSATSPAQRLREGSSVEIAGYELSPSLAQGLERANFDVPDNYTGRIAWFEMCAGEEPKLSPAATRVVERLTERGVAVNAQAICGPAFWQTVEIEESDGLLQQSRVALSDAAMPVAGVARCPTTAVEAGR
jgi:exosortase A-associated hydrolase 2